MEIKGFITNLGKYNEGELVGKWVTFPIDEDELENIKREIGCAYENEDGDIVNPEYEEVCFTDWETNYDLGLGEYPDIDFVNEVAEIVECLTGYEEDLLEAILEYTGDINYIYNLDDFALYRDVQNDYDLGYYYLEESGCYDLSAIGNLSNYFDYEAFGRDIRLETDGDFTSLGWLERR